MKMCKDCKVYLIKECLCPCQDMDVKKVNDSDYCNMCYHEMKEIKKNVNEVLDDAFEENWKELKEEREESYKIVKENLAQEAFILFTAGFMSCYEYYVKNKEGS